MANASAEHGRNVELRHTVFDAVVAEVYEPLQRYLRRRCRPEEFDDVLNETLLVIWRRLDDIPERRVLPWSYGVARRCLANARRGADRRLRLVGRLGRALPATYTEEWVGESDALLHDAIGRLSELDREVIRLWAWERLEPREIAEVLRMTPNSVSVRLTRARRRLESDVARKDPDSGGHVLIKGNPELTR